VAQYRKQLQYKTEDLGSEVGNLEYEIATLRQKKEEEIYLPQYAYWRPTFYNMIEHMTGEITNRRDHEISRDFIQKMRGIMNSKLNEFLLIDDVDRYSRFPEFVLNWLEKYDF
jgi:hypothetical protein